MKSPFFFLRQLPDSRSLVEFAILVGNDFTGPILRERRIKDSLNIMDPRDLKEIAGWIGHYGSVENHPFIKQESVSTNMVAQGDKALSYVLLVILSVHQHATQFHGQQ